MMSCAQPSNTKIAQIRCQPPMTATKTKPTLFGLAIFLCSFARALAGSKVLANSLGDWPKTRLNIRLNCVRLKTYVVSNALIRQLDEQLGACLFQTNARNVIREFQSRGFNGILRQKMKDACARAAFATGR